jgi:hypothetical protein
MSPKTGPYTGSHTMGMSAGEYRQECLAAVEILREDSMTVLSREDVVDACVGIAVGYGFVQATDGVGIQESVGATS